MKRKKLAAIGGAAAVAIVAAGGVAAASSDDDATDTPITGDAYDRAVAAALAAEPGSEVTETEVGDEESMYEVEVTYPDGRQVDVQLDESFNVVGTEADDDSGSDD